MVKDVYGRYLLCLKLRNFEPRGDIGNEASTMGELYSFEGWLLSVSPAGRMLYILISAWARVAYPLGRQCEGLRHGIGSKAPTSFFIIHYKFNVWNCLGGRTAMFIQF